MKTKKILTALFAGVVAGAALTVSSMACETCNNSVSKWDGTSIDRTWYDNDPDAETYTITSAAQFA